MIARRFDKRGVLIPLCLLFLSSCSSLPTNKRTYADNGKQIIAKEDKVEVQILKEYNVWNVYYINGGPTAKCVGTTWETMDLFENMPESLVYVEEKSYAIIGEFTQIMWKFDNLTVTVQGSGYVRDVYVIDPYKDREDCLYPKGESL